MKEITIDYFSGNNCPGCIRQQAAFDKIIPIYKNVQINKLIIGEERFDKKRNDLAKKRLIINGVPYFAIYKDGELNFSTQWLMEDDDLRDIIDSCGGVRR